ncbi:hypothetical protein [Virgibacillus sp. 6R]
MASSEEMLLYIREIYKLINEYKDCDDDDTKNKIYDNILLLSEILKS